MLATLYFSEPAGQRAVAWVRLEGEHISAFAAPGYEQALRSLMETRADDSIAAWFYALPQQYSGSHVRVGITDEPALTSPTYPTPPKE